MPWWAYVLVALLSPAAILYAGYRGWMAQRRIAAERAAFDFISRHEVSNPEWHRRKILFTTLTSAPDHPVTLLRRVEPQSDEERRDRLEILSLLGHFEAVAVGIKRGIVDEAIYKGWQKSAYIRAWNHAHQFVRDLRDKKGTPSLYEHFEELASQWAGEDAKPGHS